ncbi:tyrosine-type recombinase/integrase [Comamonas aquatica]|uniref:Tyrosine-type recombinase/integrase n=1 Tax=Comamonas aquatica TaxID=225991 RepID=A0AA43AY52_9BURK|nr:site-specific integrase [Comamonas aquatica]MDH1427351.1 tyrosine-type recombinase/integrase [Comamonas aquatica]MDH1607236.1 tyrosine-type recombinase/integrase [Comamonas aquatica]MDH1619072.1 tyrosine-type recombinase/integrase [Comamonas aquatica]MDH2007017.1 tyrosine-type recombinase/integrase [Comamonas aquatica]
MSNKHSIHKFAGKTQKQKTENKPKNKNKASKQVSKRMNGSTLQEYMNASKASATKHAYASDLRHFLAHGGTVPCTPKRLAKYLAESANDGLAIATLERRITAIHKAHVDQKQASPAHSELVKQVMQGIRRTLGTKQRQVKPLTRHDLLAALETIESVHMPVRAARDTALLLIGFASAMRRSELVGVCVEHLTFSPAGLEIELPVSKTDQERHGRTVFIPRAIGSHCPVLALKCWLKTTGIRTGHVFRSVNRYDGVAKRGLTPQSVALIVKAAIAQNGADAQHFSGHSLRAGYCTSAAEQGQQSWQIREQTGHRSDLTLARYIRHTSRRTSPSLI